MTEVDSALGDELPGSTFGTLSEPETTWFVKKCREILSGDISQAAFADLLGISRQRFEKMLTGRSKLTRWTAIGIVSRLRKLRVDLPFSSRKSHMLDRVEMTAWSFGNDSRARALHLASCLLKSEVIRGEDLTKVLRVLRRELCIPTEDDERRVLAAMRADHRRSAEDRRRLSVWYTDEKDIPKVS